VDILLEALQLAGDPPFRIVGDGPMMSGLVELARQKDLKNTVFLGQVSPREVAEQLRGSRFLALPSLWDENAPLAALEAMAAGRPLLVTDGGGLPELVSGGEGVTCRRGDPYDLATTIALLGGDDRVCLDAGAAALKRAQAEFTRTAHLSRLEEIYTKLHFGNRGQTQAQREPPAAGGDSRGTADG
jgi:glycosyltransferase involved in cell wall biosynthesis